MRTATLIAKTGKGFEVLAGWDKEESVARRILNDALNGGWKEGWTEIAYQPRSGAIRIYSKAKAEGHAKLLAARNAPPQPPPEPESKDTKKKS